MALGWRSSYFRYKQVFLNVSDVYKKRADLRAFLEIVFSIISVIVFVLFAIKPTVLTIVSLTQQIKEEKKVLAGLTKKLSDLQKASTLLSQNQQYLNDIESAVSSSPTPEILAKQIQGLASKNSVNLVSVTVEDLTLIGESKPKSVSEKLAPLPENANEMTYSVNVTGSFANINNFIKDLENMRVISTVDGLSVSSSETETGKIIIVMISGRVPYLSSIK